MQAIVVRDIQKQQTGLGDFAGGRELHTASASTKTLDEAFAAARTVQATHESAGEGDAPALHDVSRAQWNDDPGVEYEYSLGAAVKFAQVGAVAALNELWTDLLAAMKREKTTIKPGAQITVLEASRVSAPVVRITLTEFWQGLSMNRNGLIACA